MTLLRRRDEHDWSQRRLSHYVEGDLSRRERLRVQLHAEHCPECSSGIRALRALLRLTGSLGLLEREHAPTSIFDRVRADANRTGRGGAHAPEG
jgi:anti-sigma factor RsiW